MNILKAFSSKRDLLFLKHGCGYAGIVFEIEKNTYEEYKSGSTEITNKEKLDCKVLSLLEKLGYPMDFIGTYLFKDLVIEVLNYIKDIKDNRSDAYNKLFDDLEDPYSNLYHRIARDDKEIGTKSFHKYIKLAFDNINEKKIDKGLKDKIFVLDDKVSNADAFELARYICFNKEDSVKNKSSKKKLLLCCKDNLQ